MLPLILKLPFVEYSVQSRNLLYNTFYLPIISQTKATPPLLHCTEQMSTTVKRTDTTARLRMHRDDHMIYASISQPTPTIRHCGPSCTHKKPYYLAWRLGEQTHPHIVRSAPAQLQWFLAHAYHMEQNTTHQGIHTQCHTITINSISNMNTHNLTWPVREYAGGWICSGALGCGDLWSS